MNEYVPGMVYINLLKLVEYRGAKLIGDPLTQNTLSQKLNHSEFVTISAERTDPDDIRGRGKFDIVLIAPKSKYATKSAEFKKLLKIIHKTKDKNEFLFISEEIMTNYIHKQIAIFRAENPGIIVESQLYDIFMLELPKHSSIPRHELVSTQTIDNFCISNYTLKQRLAKILHTDPMAIWLGIRPGMCVKIYRLSETVGMSIEYKICIKTPKK